MAGAVVILLAGCASAPPAGSLAGTPWALQSGACDPSGASRAWRHHALPGKRATLFEYARHEGRDAIAATASSSASLLRQDVRIEPGDLGRIVFSWKVAQLIAGADLTSPDADDSPVRVVLMFDGDRSRFSARDAMLSDLMRAITGEAMPYATLMYVWGNRRPAGSVIVNARTSRVRGLVLESGAHRLNRWLDYDRDVRADYERVFGEEPGALIGLAIMTDTDNTRATARAWYGLLRLRQPHASAADAASALAP